MGSEAHESAVTDICDANQRFLASGELRPLPPIFQMFGKKKVFSGPVVTVKCFEDNVHVRDLIAQKGHGRVLVIDGCGSMRSALVGGLLTTRATNNGWAGIVVYGCIRDVDEINACDIGVRALNVFPVKPSKKGNGEKHVPLNIAGTRICDGDWLYADKDGIVVTTMRLAVYQVPSIFEFYGKKKVLSGPVVTVKCSEDSNVLVRDLVAQQGCGKILVVDGDGSTRNAFVGGTLAKEAMNNGWLGIVVYGCIGDADEVNLCDVGVLALKAGKESNGEKHIAPMNIEGTRVCDGGWLYDCNEINLSDTAGVRALNLYPVKPGKKSNGEKHVPVTIAGTRVCDGDWLYADIDGILVSTMQFDV